MYDGRREGSDFDTKEVTALKQNRSVSAGSLSVDWPLAVKMIFDRGAFLNKMVFCLEQ